MQRDVCSHPTGPLDPLRLYLRQAEQVPRLAAEEERSLAQRMHCGNRARADLLALAQAILGQRLQEPRVHRAIATLRAILTPSLLQRAREVGIDVGSRALRGALRDAAVLRAAVSIARQRTALRHRQSLDVATREALSILLRVATFTEVTMVPLATRLAASAEERRRMEEREETARDGEAARKILREANLLLVVSVAKRGHFRWGNLSLLDRVQEGNLGLLKAVDGFDPEAHGTRFSSYAVPFIAQAITRALKNQAGDIRRPLHVHDLVWRFRRQLRGLEDCQGRTVTAEAGLVQLPLDSGERRALRQALRTEHGYTLDGPDGEDCSLAVAEGDPSYGEEARERVAYFRERVQGLLGVLTAREAAIVALRLGLTSGEPKTQREIGRVFSVTRAAIQQTEVRALRKLEAAIVAETAGDGGSGGPPERTPAGATHGGYAALFMLIERTRSPEPG